ncbi:GNAT family N-acetyltransferase [Pseudomonas sp. NPDC090202]|uniref:GNAT family N-acetyltransferase n=1 Tax=unclassified Pseudomonas TaxID=196821 RepID=UPI00381D1A1C
MHNSEPLRRATPDDVDGITALVHEAYSPYIARIGKAPAPMLDDYRQVLSETDTFVIEDCGQVVGVLVMCVEDQDLLLVNVAVLPRCKGKGIGKRLMAFCEDYARSRHCDAVRLYTHERMVENIEIYSRLGYQETHRATEDGFARVFMRKVV